MNNWKEQFDLFKSDTFSGIVEEDVYAGKKEQFVQFISTEIIEKLIEDSVSLIPKGEFFRDYPTGGLEKLDQLKQDIRESLRKAWL